MCIFDDGAAVALANQENDTVSVIGFDARTRRLSRYRLLLQNPDAALSLPHGCDVSPDGRPRLSPRS
jgi:hypothetical protein